MSVVSLLQRQVESRAQLICKQRNQSVPAELGKATYETIEDGVVFIKEHFLLDSTHREFINRVAKVEWNADKIRWELFMPDTIYADRWLPYPFLSSSSDLTAIMREIDKDPKAIFWED
ncbi:DUF3024 domain-containing protein [Vibrio japonicus]|uniref:DUF3024 domain-containing protein n=1 Tax=Vibrio japonicus TaxID=1824638 RepID=A0ABY5LLM8_9VIBR|nr:DUF3024 domain-containing protein [Vibrio japonicus]UUM33013.1 DUF3024 domain-containing protein [Vibrio japonicus]